MLLQPSVVVYLIRCVLEGRRAAVSPPGMAQAFSLPASWHGLAVAIEEAGLRGAPAMIPRKRKGRCVP